jgi:hypothetical protein
VIGGFSAPPNGFWSGEMSSRQKQRTPRNGLSGTDIWISGTGHPFFKSIKFAVMTPDKRPQDPLWMGTGVRFETMEHGGEYPDTMPQAIKLIGLIAKDMRLTQRTNQRPSSAAGFDAHGVRGHISQERKGRKKSPA